MTSMRYLFSIFFITLLSCQGSGSESQPRVLVLVGGHSYDTAAFSQMFNSLEGIRFDTISYKGLSDLVESKRVSRYDLLIHYHYYPDAPEEDSSMYNVLTREGIPMLFLHHSICSYQNWKGYARIIGGSYVMPGYAVDDSLLSDYTHDLELTIRVIDQDHPATRDLADFDILDEGYANLQLVEEVVPLLRTSHPDCFPLVGWTHHYNLSATAYLIFGHDHQAYQNQSFRTLLRNTIFWLTEEAQQNAPANSSF